MTAFIELFNEILKFFGDNGDKSGASGGLVHPGVNPNRREQCRKDDEKLHHFTITSTLTIIHLSDEHKMSLIRNQLLRS